MRWGFRIHTTSISDNVTLNIDGVLYLRVVDPYKASYGVEDPEFAITQLAQTTMRSEIGKIALDTLFREREDLNKAIVEQINQVRPTMLFVVINRFVQENLLHRPPLPGASPA